MNHHCVAIYGCLECAMRMRAHGAFPHIDVIRWSCPMSVEIRWSRLGGVMSIFPMQLATAMTSRRRRRTCTTFAVLWLWTQSKRKREFEPSPFAGLASTSITIASTCARFRAWKYWQWCFIISWCICWCGWFGDPPCSSINEGDSNKCGCASIKTL